MSLGVKRSDDYDLARTLDALGGRGRAMLVPAPEISAEAMPRQKLG
jgi:hypothetical protein